MIEVDLGQFDVDGIIARCRGRVRAFAIEFVQELNQEVVENTPWVTGFLRGSWYASIGSPGGPQGSVPGAVMRMNLVAARIQLGDWYYAINGASYAVYVEFGTSKMAPRAFVRKTVARAQAIADKVAARVGAMK